MEGTLVVVVEKRPLKNSLLLFLFCLFFCLRPAHAEVTSGVIIAANAGVQCAAPENTMAALELAVEQGAKVLKIDVRSTKDGKLVLMRDETIDRTTNGHGILRGILFDELRLYDAGFWLSDKFKGETVPLLREVLRFAKLNRLKLILDVHEHGLEKSILSLLEATDTMREVYLWGALADVREIEPSIIGPKLVFLSPDNLTPAEIGDAHARGAQVMTSILNCDDRGQIEAVAKRGPDILLVDYPAVAAEALGRFSKQPISVVKIKKRGALPEGWQSSLSNMPSPKPKGASGEKEDFDLLDPVHSLYNFLLGGGFKKEDLDESQEDLPLELREKLITLRRSLREPGLEEKGFLARRWRTINKGLEEGEVEESRKAALTLAALPPEAVLPVLLKALEYKRPAVRANAAWAIGLVGDVRALPGLVNHLWDKEIEVRREAALALGRLKNPEAVEPLRKVLMSNTEAPVRYDAARALGEIASPAATADLIWVMERSEDWQLKGACARALGRIGEGKAAKPLAKLLLQESGDPATPWAKDVAGWALSELKEPPLDALMEVLRFGTVSTKSRASWAMVRMGGVSIPVLHRVLRDPHPVLRQRAIETLGWLGSDKAVPSLIRIVKENDPPQPDKVRSTAIWALGRIADSRAEKVLDEVAKNEKNNEIKEMAEEAILRLSQK
jgi:glycerophosphoryl diester phosphodiesterase